MRRRGRPKKFRESLGYNYDDAPNYGGNMREMKPSTSYGYLSEYGQS